MPNHIPVTIIGSGPSGWTAAVYASRAQLNPTLFAGFQSGGQLMWTSDVENFPGFIQGVRGPDLMSQMRQQAERFGTTIIDEYVTAVDLSQRPFKVWTNIPDGHNPDTVEKGSPEASKAWREAVMAVEPSYTTDAIIISTGASSIMLNVPGEQELLGKGLSTCAVCDAAFYKDKNTFVVGGGDSAMEDTLALTKFASSVTVVHRRDAFRASKIMQERVLSNPKVKVLWNSAIKELKGDGKLTEAVITTDGKDQTVSADGVFVAIGHRPVTQLFTGQLALDDHGYVLTRQSYSKAGVEMAQANLNEEGLVKFPSMTSVEGVFAAGDVVDVRYKQAITAAAQGCQAALDVERWLESR
jgi:thioredoxin reductase (NADPH)